MDSELSGGNWAVVLPSIGKYFKGEAAGRMQAHYTKWISFCDFEEQFKARFWFRQHQPQSVLSAVTVGHKKIRVAGQEFKISESTITKRMKENSNAHLS